MRLRVLHETHYSYSAPVHALAMEARLQPCHDDFQSCQRYRLTITPRTDIQQYTTFSDLTVHYWTLLKAAEVDVVSESMVDTRERPLLPIEAPPIELDQVAFFPYLQPTPLTGVSRDIEDFAADFVSLTRQDWYQTALAVREAIYRTLEFKVGCTNTQTTASEALGLGCGVCQDFTHVMIACLRALGIPARYVSGYLNQDMGRSQPLNAGGFAYQSMSQNSMEQSMQRFSTEVPGERSVRGTGASHAWCEVYFGPEAGWRGFDAANNLLIDQHYVRIGAGRDFGDLTPLKGVHKGPAEEQLEVVVTVKQAT
jgi:transglutaminase-like putative cysteine protease